MVYIHAHRVISLEQAIKTHYAKLKEADILLHLTLAGRSEDSIVSTGSEALNIQQITEHLILDFKYLINLG